MGLGESSQHALDLIEKIVQEAFCPVILLIHEPNPGFVREASRRGIFAYITDGDDEDDPHDGRARSTSCCAASPSTTTSGRVRAAGGH